MNSNKLFLIVLGFISAFLILPKIKPVGGGLIMATIIIGYGVTKDLVLSNCIGFILGNIFVSLNNSGLIKKKLNIEGFKSKKSKKNKKKKKKKEKFSNKNDDVVDNMENFSNDEEIFNIDESIKKLKVLVYFFEQYIDGNIIKDGLFSLAQTLIRVCPYRINANYYHSAYICLLKSYSILQYLNNL